MAGPVIGARQATPDADTLQACLPADLRGPATTITRAAVGQSGAGVFRVDAGDRSFVLKLSGEAEPPARFRVRVQIQQAVAAAGIAPRVLHVDETLRAVVTAFVVDRAFPAYYFDPRTHAAALAQLGHTLRRLHAVTLPAEATAREPHAFLAEIWAGLAEFPLPGFVTDTVRRTLAEPAPAADRAPVLSHNDVNPTNLVHDGEQLLLLDWDTAGPNDPFYDLATVAMFLRMDEPTTLALLSAYDAAPVTAVPPRFAYLRRLVAALCGTAFLHLARLRGHPGASGETLAATGGLDELYQRLRSGAVNLAAAEGQWAFGLALVKTAA